MLFAASHSRAADAGKPIRALLVTGGCCHDYANQKKILTDGISARANVTWTIVHEGDGTTTNRVSIYEKPDWSKGYDVVVHDECFSDVKDRAFVEGILKPHRAGLPAVNLHCAMHSYRIGRPTDPVTPGTPHGFWFEYLGLQSSGHGPQLPIEIKFVDKENPIAKGLSDWTTINEEHYNNIRVFETARAIASGKQVVTSRDGSARTNELVVAWVNEYGPKKTRVFSTTIGHNNATVDDARYLDLVTRGMLWACGKLDESGKPLPGYEAKK
jgi:hypothetical protein